MKTLEGIVLVGLLVLFFGVMIFLRILNDRAEKERSQQKKE